MNERQAWLSAVTARGAPSCGLEENGYARGFRSVAGLDEVGRGPLAGPVVAAAVMLPRGAEHPDIRDSKLLTPGGREAIVPWIKERSLTWGLGTVEPEEIDRINILQASLLAMARALRGLDPSPDYLLIDGPYKIPLAYLEGEGKEGRAVPHQRPVKKGDRLCLSIAAASIVAKVTRDRIMMDYDRLYPGYGFAENKGYGSRAHLAALSRYGPTPIHRKSFRPVRECGALTAPDRQRAFGFGCLASGH